MPLYPWHRPQQTRDKTEKVLLAHGIDITKPALLGVRGYFLKSMGDVDKNDRGLYDDAMIVIAPDVYGTFNCNVDPSAYRTGIASLKTGSWRYKIGKHGINREKNGGPPAYKALVQASPVTVMRDKQPDETGEFGINIHRGSETTTSSLGCQTIPPGQWDEFITLVELTMKRYNVMSIPYCLVEYQG